MMAVWRYTIPSRTSLWPVFSFHSLSRGFTLERRLPPMYCAMFWIHALCATTGDDNCSEVTCCAPVYADCVAASPSLRVDNAITTVVPIFSKFCDDTGETSENHPQSPLNAGGLRLTWPSVAWYDHTAEGRWTCLIGFSGKEWQQGQLDV